jgi:hypothetical protein
MKTYVRLWYLVELFLEWEMFRTNVIETLKIHFVFNNVFPRIHPFMR